MPDLRGSGQRIADRRLDGDSYDQRNHILALRAGRLNV